MMLNKVECYFLSALYFNYGYLQKAVIVIE